MVMLGNAALYLVFSIITDNKELANSATALAKW